jgi:peptidase YpeB-like protein
MIIREENMQIRKLAPLAFAAFAFSPAFAQVPSPGGGYIGQMSEEQVRQKLAGEGFSEVIELKKIPVTQYRWTGKAVRSGKTVEITIDERGQVSAK